MSLYTQFAPRAQVLEEIDDLDPQDILPDDFHLLAPEDQTVNAACIYARRNGFSVDEQTRRFVILSVWESGACSGAEAHGALLTEGLLDFDVLMGMYAGYVRALSRGEAV